MVYFLLENIIFFKGHGTDNGKIEVNNGKAETPAGECLVEAGYSNKLLSIHDLKVCLLEFNADRITLTLDCCRNFSRGNQIVELKYAITV